MTPIAAVVMRPLGTGVAGPSAVPATRLLAAVLAVAFLLVPAALLAPPAAADPVTVPAPTASGPLTLELSGLAPRVVVADGPTSVTVTGTLHNTGDRLVGDLEVRLQRGEALRTDGDVRDALAGVGRADAATPAFTSLPGTLAPGGSMPVTLTVPLRGDPTEGLALDRPGVYEFLVNVNGVPQDGLRARLAAARLLLPVLSLPAGPGATPVGPTVPADPPGLTVLYPLVDTPHRLPTVPGEQTLLADDDLARSLAPDGRLGGLLAAFAEGAPTGSAVRAATCLAVDPDLVAAAAAMRQGYAVRGPTGTVPGTGADVAGTWLDTLAATARGGCVVALPFADADLVALTRGQLGDLGRLAVADAGAVVTEALGTPVLDATTWPSGGVLDEPALAGVADAGARAVVLDASSVDGDAGTVGAVPVAVGSSSVLAVLTDPLLARAADAPETSAPAIPGTATTVSATTSPSLATQDAAAALVFRAQAAKQPVGGAPIVLAPPHVWRTDKTGAGALLAAVNLLLDTGRVRARPLGDVVAAGPSTPGAAQRPADPLQAGRRDTPPTVLESVRKMRADVLDLRSAAVPETGVGATVEATFEPLLQAVLRPASATWHGRPDLAASAATAAGTRIGELRDSIRVLTPPSPYSLGTTDAPLLLAIANGLPVTMEVRLSISSTTGLRVAPIPPQRIPPLGRRQVQVSAEVVRSGQFSVEATVHSPAGRALGPPSRLQVHSTAYGTITVWLTGSAAVLLVVLAAHRVVRRVRGEPSPRDRTGPSVSPPTPETPRPETPTPETPTPETPTPETPTPETPRPEPEAAAPALLTDLPTAPVHASDPEPPTTPVRTPPDPEPPTRPVPARRP